MEISPISSNYFASTSLRSSSAASQVNSLNVQDKVTIAVLNSIQDQQKSQADSLIKMMQQSSIDIYA